MLLPKPPRSVKPQDKYSFKTIINCSAIANIICSILQVKHMNIFDPFICSIIVTIYIIIGYDLLYPILKNTRFWGKIILAIVYLLIGCCYIVLTIKHNNKAEIYKNDFLSETYLDFSLNPFYSGQTFKIFGGGFSIILKFSKVETHLLKKGSAPRAINEQKDSISTDNHFLDVKVTNYRVYLSFTVKDLKTDEIIAQMIDNVWKIRKAKIATYYPDDNNNSIKIIDNYGNIAFELWQDLHKDIQVRGYSVGAYCTQFYYDGVVNVVYKNDPEYLEKAKQFAEMMTSEIR